MFVLSLFVMIFVLFINVFGDSSFGVMSTSVWYLRIVFGNDCVFVLF